MRIGELAKATGTKAETIRYYEREGILPAADRTDTNYRDYSDNHLAALTFVRRARQLGFSMAQVRELLALSNHEDNPCQDVERLVQLQLTEVERKIADLMALRDELGQMLRSCQADKIGECQIIGSLGRQSVTLDLDDRPLMGDPEKRWNGRHWGAIQPSLPRDAFRARKSIPDCHGGIHPARTHI